MAKYTEEQLAQMRERLQMLKGQDPVKKLSPKQMELIDNLQNRGRGDLVEKALNNLGLSSLPEVTLRDPEIMRQVVEETGPIKSLLIGAGKGLENVMKGVGAGPPMIESGGYEMLKEERPYTTGIGEIVGEALPFAGPGGAIGRVGSKAGRLALGTGLAATEGGVLSRAQEQDTLAGAGVGAGIGLAAETLLPVVGRIGRKIFEKLTGRLPRGVLIDQAGKPTKELTDALDSAGLNFDDLKKEAVNEIKVQKPGADPQQVARKAMFAEEGIPASRGDIIQGSPEGFRQQATEQRLLESVEDTAGEKMRDFKLRQSEAIEETLRKSGMDVTNEETGGLIQDALSGREKLLNTEKNELYEQFAKASKEAGDIPLFTDNISSAIPDADTMEELALTSDNIMTGAGPMKNLDLILQKYGFKELTQEGIDYGFTPTPLTVTNFDRFRKALRRIQNSDTSGAASVAINPIRDALDKELAEFGEIAAENGISIPGEILEPLKKARKTVRQLKTEFSPQSLVGRIVDTKKDGVTQIIEASKVFDKMVAKTIPVEDIRKVVTSLKASPKGNQALASLQSSVLLDLINAGFGTQSRKIKGKGVFNPIAFKNRLNSIGDDKLKSIFSTSPETLKKLSNIDKIARELTPPSGTVQKGSANIILDVINTLGLAGIMAKVPGGALLVGGYKSIADPVKKAIDVKKAMDAKPEINKFLEMMEEKHPIIAGILEAGPGVASAFTIPATIDEE